MTYPNDINTQYNPRTELEKRQHNNRYSKEFICVLNPIHPQHIDTDIKCDVEDIRYPNKNCPNKIECRKWAEYWRLPLSVDYRTCNYCGRKLGPKQKDYCSVKHKNLHKKEQALAGNSFSAINRISAYRHLGAD